MPPDPADTTVRPSLRLITVAGCLAIVFLTCLNSPATDEFLRQLEASDAQVGIFKGLATALMGVQFLGAYLTNRLSRRKPLFMIALITGRLLFFPLAALPVLFPDADRDLLITWILLLAAAGHFFQNLGVAPWFSWMGDLIPKRILNRYWGSRQRFMTLTWSVVFICMAILFRLNEVGESPSFLMVYLLISGVAVFSGVVDILLFIWVEEPENTVTISRSPLDLFLEPLRNPQYRRFLVACCSFMFAVMCASAFMPWYLLKVMQVPLVYVLGLWCLVGLGGALTAKGWGRLADRFGQRPVMLCAIAGKPLAPLAFILITPETAFWVMVFFLPLDNILNTGWQVAQQGYMLKMSPRENRSMFVSAFLAFTGICGGISAALGGQVLKGLEGVFAQYDTVFLGREWNHYQAIFLLSFLMRCGAWLLFRRIREPESHRTLVMINHLLGAWPLRFITYPTGLYRRLSPFDEDEETDGEQDQQDEQKRQDKPGGPDSD